MRVILASTSPYRQTLLRRLGLPFDIRAPNVEENALPGESPEAQAGRLAISKARDIAGSHPDCIVIGSDQVASLGGTAIGKPGDFNRARRQLQQSSGKRVTFYTGLCVIGTDGSEHCRVTPFQVQFRRLSDAEIDRYLMLEEPYDCAGSFKWEGLGISLFEKLSGDDPTALEGLPLIALCDILAELGAHPLRAIS
jgi:septum formation protein